MRYPLRFGGLLTVLAVSGCSHNWSSRPAARVLQPPAAAAVSADDVPNVYRATGTAPRCSDPLQVSLVYQLLPKGTLVRFEREPGPVAPPWVKAELTDGTVTYVHPADFERVHMAGPSPFPTLPSAAPPPPPPPAVVATDPAPAGPPLYRAKGNCQRTDDPMQVALYYQLLPAGTLVRFDQTPGPSSPGWMRATLDDGTKLYVHPADFELVRQ